MQMFGKHLEVHTEKTPVFSEFIAPSHVHWVRDSKRQTEGVSPLHLSQGQLTGWDLIAPE